jgi:hypothetical protein
MAIILLYDFGSYRHWFTINHTNLWFLNYEMTFEYLFYSYFLISAFPDKNERKRLSIVTFTCLVFTIVDIFFIQGKMRLCTIAIVIQYALLIALVCRFFYLQLQQIEGNTSILKKPDFWVGTGILFFFLTEFLGYVSFNMAYTSPGVFRYIYSFMGMLANIILYTCLVVAFLCFSSAKKTRA